MFKAAHLIKALLFLFFLILLYGTWQTLPIQEWSELAGQLAQEKGLMGVLLYSLIFVVATIFLFPCAFLTFVAGVVYGAWGVPLILLATSIGASFSFCIARRFAREEVSFYMNKRPFTRALKTAIEREDWKFLVLFRISPLIPFNLNNYFLGTVKVRFSTFLWTTILGAMPGTFLFTYLGSLGRTFKEQQNIQWLSIGTGFIATYLLARMTLKKTKEILYQNHEMT